MDGVTFPQKLPGLQGTPEPPRRARVDPKRPAMPSRLASDMLLDWEFHGIFMGYSWIMGYSWRYTWNLMGVSWDIVGTCYPW